MNENFALVLSIKNVEPLKNFNGLKKGMFLFYNSKVWKILWKEKTKQSSLYDSEQEQEFNQLLLMEMFNPNSNSESLKEIEEPAMLIAEDMHDNISCCCYVRSNDEKYFTNIGILINKEAFPKQKYVKKLMSFGGCYFYRIQEYVKQILLEIEKQKQKLLNVSNLEN